MAIISTTDVLTNPNTSVETAKNGSIVVNGGGLQPFPGYSGGSVKIVSTQKLINLSNMYDERFKSASAIDGGTP